jgi:hypothetical protein
VRDQDWLDFLWLLMAAMAGALTALSFKQFQPLTTRERIMLVFVGFVFAIFVGPLIVGWILPDERASSRIVGALYYIIAAGSNWLLPWAIEKATGIRPEKKS